MPKKWSEIQADPDFQGLPDTEKAKVADRFFQTRVANDPNFLGLPPQEQEKVRSRFNLKPSESGGGFEEGLETAGKVAGIGGGIIGTAAPIAAAVIEGAPLAPVIGGLGLGALVGAGTDYALNEISLPERIPIPGSAGASIPLPGAIAGRPIGESLKAGAQGLRELDPIPDPETQSVGLNMLLQGVKGSFDPIEKAASAMEMAPQVASTYAAMKAGGLGSRMLSPSKVPVGKEAAALGKVAEGFGGAARKPSAPTQGGLEELLLEGRKGLGDIKGTAEEAAFSKARPYTNMGEHVAEELGKVNFNKAFPEGHPGRSNPALATNPAAAGEVMGSAGTALKEVTDLPGASALQGQLAEKAALARSKVSPTRGQAPILSEASGRLDSMIKSFLNPSAPETKNLEAANLKFSNFRNMEDLFKGAGDKAGNPSPQRILKRWNQIKPGDKVKKYGPEGSKILDAILKQKDPNIISRGLTKLWNGVVTVGNTRLGSMLKSGGVEPPIRLNAPNPYSLGFGIPELEGQGLGGLLQQGSGAGGYMAEQATPDTLRNRYRANIGTAR